mmetsp:Transcript_51739/g.92928  ORF Transcript_51739/g.92928 Transcript_51739/m.92928 type:complete len:96 (-) Transcript_51739:97-384(-)
MSRTEISMVAEEPGSIARMQRRCQHKEDDLNSWPQRTPTSGIQQVAKSWSKESCALEDLSDLAHMPARTQQVISDGTNYGGSDGSEDIWQEGEYT